MKPTRVWDLVALFVIATVAAWLLVRTLYGDLPPLPVFAGASLYPVAVLQKIS